MTDIPTLQQELDTMLARARDLQAAIVQARIDATRPIEREPGALLYSAIGSAIRARRSEQHITQEVLAGGCNVLRTSIANIEAGRQRLPIDLLYDIADVLGVEATSLLPRNEEV